MISYRLANGKQGNIDDPVCLLTFYARILNPKKPRKKISRLLGSVFRSESMKRLATFGLLFSLLAGGFASAFDTSQSVTATPITTLPFTITTSGNYFLPANLSVATGTGITVNADSVVIDLNGRSLTSTGGTIGIQVNGRHGVVIQNGDIDNFNGTGNHFGIFLNGSANGQNQKNRVSHVNFNDCFLGVILLRGSIDLVEYCNFDGGTYGIYDIAADGGDRFQADNFQNQAFGIVSVQSPGAGNLIEDCLFANESAAGFFAGNAGDRSRFNTSVNGVLHIGGIIIAI